MNTIVLLSSDSVLLGQLQAAFARKAADMHVVLADAPEAVHAQVAACWFPPAGSLKALPNLRLVHSVAAGIDHLQSDPSRPDLPICRVVDPAHRQGMTEYVRWAVLHFHRGFDRVLRQQPERLWQRHPQHSAAEFKVGVMGLGSLGAAIAQDLAAPGIASGLGSQSQGVGGRGLPSRRRAVRGLPIRARCTGQSAAADTRNSRSTLPIHLPASGPRRSDDQLRSRPACAGR